MKQYDHYIELEKQKIAQLISKDGKKVDLGMLIKFISDLNLPDFMNFYKLNEEIKEYEKETNK
jgi:hypothetical protein